LTLNGFSEVYLYTLVPKGDIAIAHPLASDKGFLRTNLSESMFKSLERNALNADLLGLDAIRIFEIGKVFTKDKESLSLSIGVSLVKKVKGRKSEDEIKDAILLVEKELGMKFPKATMSASGIHAVAEIILDAVIPASASYEDLAFTKAAQLVYKPFSSYPFIVRDIALFTPDSISENDVWNEIEKGIEEAGAMKLLVRSELFDVFKKDGKTSYAFRMVFQSMEKTLTDVEVNEIKDWQVR
jgi:phenylalanyl-tRNA synthetase beta subunit